MKIFLVPFFVLLTLGPKQTSACYDHFMIDSDRLGFMGGTMTRMAGLTPPKPTFEIEHPPMMRARVGEKGEIIINYSRPVLSKNVRLTVWASENVALDSEELPLEKMSGSVNLGYELTANAGYASIILTVVGEHFGKVVNQSSRIYLRGV